MKIRTRHLRLSGECQLAWVWIIKNGSSFCHQTLFCFESRVELRINTSGDLGVADGDAALYYLVRNLWVNYGACDWQGWPSQSAIDRWPHIHQIHEGTALFWLIVWLLLQAEFANSLTDSGGRVIWLLLRHGLWVLNMSQYNSNLTKRCAQRRITYPTYL